MQNDTVLVNIICMAGSVNPMKNIKNSELSVSPVQKKIDQTQKTRQRKSSEQVRNFKQKNKEHLERNRQRLNYKNSDLVWKQNLEANAPEHQYVDTNPGGNYSNSVAIIDNKYYTRIGKGAPYNILKTDKLQIVDYLAKNHSNVNELCSTDADHLNCKAFRELLGLSTNQSWAVNSTSILNQSREYAKKGQRLPFKIDQYNDILLPDLVGHLYQQSFDGMIENAMQRQPKHIDFLNKYCMLDPLLGSYKQNSKFEVIEICNFADNYQLPYTKKEIISTFYITHGLKKALETVELMKANTNYSMQGQKFCIDYVIQESYLNFEAIINWISSTAKYCDLNNTHPFTIYIENRIEYISNRLKSESLDSVARYKNNMISCGLPKESSESLEALKNLVEQVNFKFQSSKTVNTSDLLDIHNSQTRISGFNIGHLNSLQKVPSFLVSPNTNFSFIQDVGGLYQFDEPRFNNNVNQSTKLNLNKSDITSKSINQTELNNDVLPETFYMVEETLIKKNQGSNESKLSETTDISARKSNANTVALSRSNLKKIEDPIEDPIKDQQKKESSKRTLWPPADGEKAAALGRKIVAQEKAQNAELKNTEQMGSEPGDSEPGDSEPGGFEPDGFESLGFD